jgi:hypothetical protein
VEDPVRQIGQLAIVLFDVQDVGVEVHVLIAEGVDLSELLEPVEGNVIVQGGVASVGNLVDDIDTVGEVLDEGTVQIHTVSLLLDVQIVVGKVEVIHPVVLAGPGFKQLEDAMIVITLSDERAELEPSGPEVR